MRSRWEGGWECARQSWCAREASCLFRKVRSGSMLVSELFVGVGAGAGSGKLQISQTGLRSCSRSRSRSAAAVAGFSAVEGSDFPSPPFGSTIERYLSAILGPGPVPGPVDVVLVLVLVVLSSCCDERTNGTRLRRIPAPKTRWSSRGRK